MKNNSDSNGTLFAWIVYWGNMIAAVLCCFALFALMVVPDNALTSDAVLNVVLTGGDLNEIWNAAGLIRPHGHWYWMQGLIPDALAMAAVMIGVYAVHGALLWVFPGALRRRQTVLWLFALVMNGVVLPFSVF